MASYDFSCRDCGEVFEINCPMSQSGLPRPCPGCASANTDRIFTVPGMVFAGDGWASKNNRVQGQMRAKNAKLDLKSEERSREASIHLAPNVDGERVDSWSDAQKLAASKGKDTTSYAKHVRQESKK